MFTSNLHIICTRNYYTFSLITEVKYKICNMRTRIYAHCVNAVVDTIKQAIKNFIFYANLHKI